MSRSPGILATRGFVNFIKDTDRLLIKSEIPKSDYTVSDGYQDNQCVAKVDIKERGLEPTNYTLTIRYNSSYLVAYVYCEIHRGDTVIPRILPSGLFSKKINGWFTYTTTVYDGTAPAGSTDFYCGDIVKCSLDKINWVTEELLWYNIHNPWTISMTGTE